MINGESVDHLPFMPITMMFAAREGASKYRDYVLDHRVLVESQLRTAEKFMIDHVSAISDPAREAFDCGAPVEFFDDQPPAFDDAKALLLDKRRLSTLRSPDPSSGKRMLDRLMAVSELNERAGSDRLIEGWIEGPCAQACNLRGINAFMLDFYEDPDFVRRLLDFVTELEQRFAVLQIEAGAGMIGIGDAAASLISCKLYRDFIWKKEKQLVDAIHARGALVRLHICGDTTHLLADIGRLGCDVVDVDYLVSMRHARETIALGQVLLGNVDPVKVIRNGVPAEVSEAVKKCHEEAGSRFIVGAGCEIPADSPGENLLALGEYARNNAASFLQSKSE